MSEQSLQLNPKTINLAGRTFSRLLVISYAGSINGKVRWRCLCECGTEVVVVSEYLRIGKTRSCGCLQAEVSAAKGRARSLHKGRGTLTYSSWKSMRARCNNPNDPSYPRYGGAGVTVDPRWDKYENFLADMGERPSKRHSIDRIDVNGSYTPGNCRWATSSQQQRNKKNTTMIEFNGELRVMAEVAEIIGIPLRFLHNRRASGWTDYEIVSTPHAKSTSDYFDRVTSS